MIQRMLARIVILLASVFLFGYSQKSTTPFITGLHQPSIQEWKYFDVNRLNATINSSGPFFDYLRSNTAGLLWPKGSNKSAVFTAGIWIIGKHKPSGLLRTAVQDYQTEYQPGPINGIFNTTLNTPSVVSDPTDPKYRIYKINRSDTVGGINPDFDQWPGDLGAPFVDMNNNKNWDKGIDKPKFWGDQVLWSVYNDGNLSNHLPVGRTEPMGIEVQATYFGFDQPDPIGNVVYFRWKVINKSDADYDSVYFSMWSDTDLGDATDDMVGVDSARNLTYVYNGDNDDEGSRGYGNKPPASGFVLLQGPMVPGAGNDTATAESNKYPGRKNLRSISAITYTNGGVWPDPPIGSVLFAEQAFRYQQGLIGTNGKPFIDPLTNKMSRFVFHGDPVTNTGWTQSVHGIPPTDVRSMISTGPFYFAKGDTQEIVGAFVIAQGTDRLNSIVKLRQAVDSAKSLFTADFKQSSATVNPFAISTSRFNKKILLEWGKPEVFSTTEQYRFTGEGRDYRFEGYRVFQFSGNHIGAEKKLIATFDLVNNVTSISDWVFDPVSGSWVYRQVAHGPNTGIRRYIVIDKDAFTGDSLINEQEYYFAVTGYYFNHSVEGLLMGLPNMLETGKKIVAVTPKAISPGNPASIGQSLLTDWSQYGQDAVRATVIDPSRLVGAKYEVTFNGKDTTDLSWNLKRSGFGPDVMLLEQYPDFSGSDASPIFDGIQFKVERQPFGVRRDHQSPKGYEYFPDSSALWFAGQTAITAPEAFGNGLFHPTNNNFVSRKSKLPPWDLRRVELRFSNSTKQKAYRYVDYNSPSFVPLQARHPSFLPYLKHRGPGGQFIYQDYVDVPFTAWEVDGIDGSAAPRQLNAGFLEKNDTLFSVAGEYRGAGHVNGKWHPTIHPTGGYELLFIFSSDYSADTLPRYTRNPQDPSNNTRFLDLRNRMDSIDVLYALWVKAKDSTISFGEGDKFIIRPNYPLMAGQTYTILSPIPMNTRNSVQAPFGFALGQNYPNPFNPNTTIQYQIPEHGNVQLQIFNLLGQEVKRVVSEFQQPGNYRVTWDGRTNSGKNAASGVYVYRLTVGKFSDVKKMILIK